MPFYKINGMSVHIRGSKKLPPGCRAGVGIESVAACLAPSGYQCDWDIGSGKTCDRHLCAAHAHQVAKNRHYCPAHFQEHTASQRQTALFTELVQP